MSSARLSARITDRRSARSTQQEQKQQQEQRQEYSGSSLDVRPTSPRRLASFRELLGSMTQACAKGRKHACVHEKWLLKLAYRRASYHPLLRFDRPNTFCATAVSVLGTTLRGG